MSSGPNSGAKSSTKAVCRSKSPRPRRFGARGTARERSAVWEVRLTVSECRTRQPRLTVLPRHLFSRAPWCWFACDGRTLVACLIAVIAGGQQTEMGQDAATRSAWVGKRSLIMAPCFVPESQTVGGQPSGGPVLLGVASVSRLAIRGPMVRPAMVIVAPFHRRYCKPATIYLREVPDLVFMLFWGGSGSSDTGTIDRRAKLARVSAPKDVGRAGFGGACVRVPRGR